MTTQADHDDLDDLIAAAMQAEIPAPPSDYWTRIDRSLTRAAVRGPANVEDRRRFVDTDGDVVRLTGMNAPPRSSTGWTSTRFLVTAAALVVVIALAGAAAFAEFSDSPIGVDSTSGAADDASTTRQPVTSEPTPAEPTPAQPADVVVGSFEPGAVTDAGLEGVGCWFYRGGNDADLVFHGGFEATVMILDGRQIIGDTSGFWSVEDTVTAGGYEIRFTDVGAPVADSIESQRQPATLVVTPTDPTRAPVTIPGDLWCGV